MRLSDCGEYVEVFFSDFTPEAQRELLELMGLKDASDANWDGDIFPVADIPIGEDLFEEEKDEVEDEDDDRLWDGDEFVGDDDDEEDDKDVN